MKRVLLTALIALTACGDKNAENEATAADTAALAAPTPVDSAAVVPDSLSKGRGTQVDGSAIRVGQTVAGMQLVAKEIQPAAASPLGVTGSMTFKGELELSGSYRAHYEYPEVKEPCFWVDPHEWTKVPRQKGDERIIWFCFTNQQEAIAQLGALGSNVKATIVIDDYKTNLQQSDVWDQARLVRVVKKEKAL